MRSCAGTFYVLLGSSWQSMLKHPRHEISRLSEKRQAISSVGAHEEVECASSIFSPAPFFERGWMAGGLGGGEGDLLRCFWKINWPLLSIDVPASFRACY